MFSEIVCVSNTPLQPSNHEEYLDLSFPLLLIQPMDKNSTIASDLLNADYNYLRDEYCNKISMDEIVLMAHRILHWTGGVGKSCKSNGSFYV